jgi:hypothetical protein
VDAGEDMDHRNIASPFGRSFNGSWIRCHEPNHRTRR